MSKILIHIGSDRQYYVNFKQLITLVDHKLVVNKISDEEYECKDVTFEYLIDLFEDELTKTGEVKVK